MKNFRILILATALFSAHPIFSAGAAFSITSPDHPPDWYNRAGEKLSETLSWSTSKQELFLTVAYSNIAATSFVWRDQTYVDSFNLSFPSVRLDRSDNRLYIREKGNRIGIGRLEPGLFGSRVILDEEVSVSAQRRNGYVEAAITGGKGAAP